MSKPGQEFDSRHKTVGILIFDNVEVLDVAGPFEVFSVTRLDENKRDYTDSPFRIYLIAEKEYVIRAIGGLKLTPDYTFNNCPKLDLFIVPGGWGTRSEINNLNLIQNIHNLSQNSSLTASVCTGSSLLGKAGLLEGKMATTHWRTFNFLGTTAPNAKIKRNVLFTEDQKIFTSAGVTSGISLALHLVSYFFGLDVGMATARFMEFPYPTHNTNPFHDGAKDARSY
ncbi:DJ-1/PfpI family protein [Candidatus Nitrosocosmicus franklandus]|uniref:Transcriptional regulator containing an amidase domain and an AraC-type DNA-binding HTH domain n=1 Tax=Candidatus Nitrosocosmicus franklandianus TaxID=1798806 RepID=A0A484IEM6_9ARCH|nr:DJ-1/PfpI family protein [Candidatus Nitrosocosmicus franklandus]VFJ14599.1 Transcriptional regulator containing an amidase domain and an AraC-type DNA-binding HTH domain [Candidatus Nitrosocosmicus franklandus]